MAPYVLPTVLAGLAERLPALTLRVVEDQTERLLAALREGALDAALIALPAETSGLTAVPIYDEDFVLALPRGIRCPASGGCRRRRWRTCRCCCSTRATACAIRRWTCATRRASGPRWLIPGRRRWRRQCNA
ncbi:lysR substrate binding domain protein [Mycobacterium xenopi 3993]|nr:lysR substrate binding domain protein [Mycobacterium xenopi 3993]